MSEPVSTFLGITIEMWVDPAQPYAEIPHLHGSYNTRVAAYGIHDGQLLANGLSPRADAFIAEWIGKNRAALIKNWALIHENRPPEPIEGLE